MNTLSLGHPGEMRSYAQGLLLSTLIHGLAIGFAVTVLSDLQLAPEPEPFRWEVSMMETAASTAVEPPAPAQSEPTPAAQPVSEPVQTVQTVQQVVRQEVRTVSQVVQTTVQPSQVVSRAVQSVQSVQREAAPVENAPAERPDQAVEATQSPAVTRSESATVPASIQQASITKLPVRSGPQTKADYGWLADALRRRVEALKRYPHLAQMNRWEGKVVLRAVIKEDGQLLDIIVAESSGHSVLDQDALDVMRRASPLKLKHPLGKSQVVVQVPISYKLN